MRRGGRSNQGSGPGLVTCVILDVFCGALLELQQQLVGHLAALDHRVLEEVRAAEASEHRLVSRDRVEDLLSALGLELGAQREERGPRFVKVLPKLGRNVRVLQLAELLEKIRQLLLVLGKHERVGRHHEHDHRPSAGRCVSRGPRKRTFRNRDAHIRVEQLMKGTPDLFRDLVQLLLLLLAQLALQLTQLALHLRLEEGRTLAKRGKATTTGLEQLAALLQQPLLHNGRGVVEAVRYAVEQHVKRLVSKGVRE